jgi:hypothetical protein
MRNSIFLACLALAVLVPANFAAAQSAEDKAFAQQIGRGLKESGQLRDYRIGVKYQQGVAWLSGSVTDRQQAETALRLTNGMPGVNRVVNNLSIAGAAPASPHAKSLELNQPLRQASAQMPPSGRPPVNQAYMPPQGMPPQGMPRQGMPPAQAMQMQRQAMRPMPPQGPQGMNPQMNPQMMQRRPMPQMPPGQGPMQAGCNCGGGPAYGGGGYGGEMMGGGPAAMGQVPGAYGGAVNYDNAQMPGYAWPSYASYPNYAALTYPRQYSPTAWPYIGPFYPYPQVPLGWRKVSLEWDDGWWFLDFSDCGSNH